MTTRRRFLSALASLAAASGLSRYAPGAVAATEKGAKPEGNPKGVPQPGEPLSLSRTAWVTGFEPGEPLPSGQYVCTAFSTPGPDGRWYVHYRIMRLDEAGRLLEVSPAMFPPANG